MQQRTYNYNYNITIQVLLSNALAAAGFNNEFNNNSVSNIYGDEPMDDDGKFEVYFSISHSLFTLYC